MTVTALRKPSAAVVPYWDMLKKLSNPVKMELVALLSDSVAFGNVKAKEHELTEEERKAGLMSLAGCWVGDPDAERMEAAIKECRKNDVLREVNLDD